MIVSFRLDDGEVEQVSTDDLSAIESADIETALGGTPWREVEDRLRGQDPTAMRAVLWAGRRRTDKTLRFDAFDLPGWRRRLTCRIERPEIDDVLDNLLAEALGTGEDAAIEQMLPHLRKLAADQADVDAALNALEKAARPRARRSARTDRRIPLAAGPLPAHPPVGDPAPECGRPRIRRHVDHPPRGSAARGLRCRAKP